MMRTSLGAVEDLLIRLCCALGPEYSSVDAAVSSHLSAGGGRLRAAICLDAAERVGVDSSDAIRLAAICELLHNASLIHDDLLDRSMMRRGCPSIWYQYSDTIAVCAGDLMLAAAFSAVSGLSVDASRTAVSALTFQRVSEVIRGQVREQQVMDYAQDAQAEYENRARGKSASLLSLALELPLLYAGRTDLLATTNELVGDFATAYQIADDLLDIEPDSAEGLLNIVLVMERSMNLPREFAKDRAAKRGLDLLERAVKRAELLPFNCADLLVGHAKKLQAAMEAHLILTTAGS